MAEPLSSDALTREVATLLGALPDTLPALSPLPTLPAPEALPGLIDHTLLAPHSTPDDIARVCAEGAALHAATVCVNSSMLPFAAAALQGHDTRPIATVGFPFGAGGSAAKALEARTAVEQGAAEIDMVQNVGLLRAGHLHEVYLDVRGVVEASKPAPVKVILETASLKREEIAISSLISCLAGAAFIKTSTGYGPGGATPEAVRLMHFIAAPRGVAVKASGGIRTLAAVRSMVESGATRVGASGTAAIASEAHGGAAATGSGY